MKSYLIILSLKFPDNAYPELFAYVKSANLWSRPNTNTWIIKTSASIDILRNGLKEKIGPEDSVLVLEILPSTPWASFNIPRSITDWMKKYL